jgi:hypothetical protein
VLALWFPLMMTILNLFLDPNQVFVIVPAYLLSLIFAVLAGFVSTHLIDPNHSCWLPKSFTALWQICRNCSLARVVVISSATYAWIIFMTSIAITPSIRMHIIPPDPSWWWGFVTMLVVMGWHFIVVTIAAWGSDRQRSVVVFVALVVILYVIAISPVSVGATPFRLMGIGGGIPISAMVRVVDKSSGELQIRRMEGCLVLSFGNQVSIQSPSDAGSQIHCHLSPLTPVVEKGVIVRTAVHTLLRTDWISTASEFL